MKANTQAAKALGAVAFANGIQCAPALDAAVSEMLKGRQVGDSRTAPELKAWIAGWMQALMAEEVTA